MTISTGLFVFLFVLELLGMVLYFLFMRSRFSRARLLADVRAEVDKLIIDLGREADRDVALLESRIHNLRSLMDEADRRILLADAETARRRDAVETAAALAKPRQGDSIGISAAVRTVREVAPVPTPEPEPITVYTRPAVKRSEIQLTPVIPLQERVLDMARKNISNDLIASTMSISLGEVELIIAMNSSSL